MNFDYSDDQKMLQRTVKDFAKKESPVSRFRSLRDEEGQGWAKETWKQMGELGWLGVPFSEQVGGLGGDFVECGLILEQLGTTLVPEPYLASVCLAGTTLAEAGNPAQHAAFLEPMLEGDTSLALAALEADSRYNTARCTTTAIAEDGGYRISGKKTFVLNGHAADHIVVSAMVNDSLALFVVDGDAEGLLRETIRLFDGHRGAVLTLDDVKVGEDRRLAAGDAGQVLALAMDRGAAGAVAEGVGVARSILAMTLEYLKTRSQFGVKIGSFQALQHRAVDMFVEVELLRAISGEASVLAAGNGDDPERARAISAAKVQLSTGATAVSREAIQLHGGIGCTDEADIGLYFKRMHALTTIGGDELHHLRRYAEGL